MPGYFDRLLRQADAGGARAGRSSPSPAPPAASGDLAATEERIVPAAPSSGDAPPAASPPAPRPGDRPVASPPPTDRPVSSAEAEPPDAAAGEPPAEPGSRRDEPTPEGPRRAAPRPPEAREIRRPVSTDLAPADAGAAMDGADEREPARAGDVTRAVERPARRDTGRPGEAGDPPSAARVAPEPEPTPRTAEGAPPAEPSDPAERRPPLRDGRVGERLSERGRPGRAAAGHPEEARPRGHDPYRALADARKWVAATPAPGETEEPDAGSAPASPRPDRRDAERGEARDIGRRRRAPVPGPLESATRDVRLSIGRIELTLEGVDEPSPPSRRPAAAGASRERGARSRLRRHYLRLP